MHTIHHYTLPLGMLWVLEKGIRFDHSDPSTELKAYFDRELGWIELQERVVPQGFLLYSQAYSKEESERLLSESLGDLVESSPYPNVVVADREGPFFYTRTHKGVKVWVGDYFACLASW